MSTPPAASDDEYAEGLSGPDAADSAQVEDTFEKNLQSPAAREEQERSESVHADASATESTQLLRREFHPELASLNNDPVRTFDRVEAEKFIADSVVRVDSAGDAPDRILVSSTPLREETDAGVAAPVSADLRREGQTYEPRNPVTEVALPATGSGPVDLKRADVSLSMADASKSVGRELDGDKLFYHEVLRDTDALIAPIAPGAELYAQLRSSNSPSRITFDVSIPDGGLLEDAGFEGVEVLEDGKRIALISAPFAVDAQGRNVPVRLEVSGANQVDLMVDHTADDLAYPILVDPILSDTENWTSSGSGSWVGGTPGGQTVGMSHWKFRTNYDFPGSDRTLVTDNDGNGNWEYAGIQGCWYSVACWNYNGSNSGKGLYNYIRADHLYPDNTFGEWFYTAPGTTSYISSFKLAQYYYWIAPNGTATTPHLYYGIHNGTNNTWTTATVAPGFPKYRTGQSSEVSNANETVSTNSTSGNRAVFGMASNGATPQVWRAGMLGGAQIWLGDNTAPTFDPPTSEPPTGWLDGDSFDIGLTARDSGLGLRMFKVTVPQDAGPDALGGPQPQDSSCVGTRHGGLCPASLAATSANAHFDTDDMPEGINVVTATAKDAVGNLTSPNKTWTVKVDRTAPIIQDVDGPLFEGAGGPVSAGDSTLSVTATDTPSGIAEVELLVDGVVVDDAAGGCAPTGCSLDAGLAALPEGTREVGVRVIDQAGNIDEDEWEVDLDRSQPSLSVGGPVVDAPSTELIGVESNLSFDAGDSGGSGLVELEVKIDSQTIDSVTRDEIVELGGTEECVGGACEYHLDHQLLATDLLSGTYPVVFLARDGAGNETAVNDQIYLDAEAPTIELDGDLIDSAGQPLAGDSAAADMVAEDGSAATDSGIEQLVVEIDDGEVSSVEADCSDGCPEEETTNYEYVKSQFAPGPHLAEFRAIDQAGNESSSEVEVDGTFVRSSPPDCSDESPTELSPSAILTVEQAEDALEGSTPAIVEPSIPTENPDPEAVGDLRPSLFQGFEETPEEDGSLNADDFVVSGALVESRIDPQPAGGFTIGPSACLRPLHTTEAETPAALVEEDSIVHANSAPATDTVIRPNAAGTTAILNIRSSAAPATFSWDVALHDGTELEQVPNGSIAVVDSAAPDPHDDPVPGNEPGELELVPDAADQLDRAETDVESATGATDGTVHAVVEEPWGIDANGASVPVTLSVQGDTIQLSVSHSNAAFPVSVVMPTSANKGPIANTAGACPIAAGNTLHGHWYFYHGTPGNLKKLKATSIKAACVGTSKHFGGNRLYTTDPYPIGVFFARGSEPVILAKTKATVVGIGCCSGHEGKHLSAWAWNRRQKPIKGYARFECQNIDPICF